MQNIYDQLLLTFSNNFPVVTQEFFCFSPIIDYPVFWLACFLFCCILWQMEYFVSFAGKKLSGCENVVPVMYTLDIVTFLASFCILQKRNFLIVRTQFLLCSPVDTVTFLLLLCSFCFLTFIFKCHLLFTFNEKPQHH